MQKSSTEFTIMLQCSCEQVISFDVGIDPQIEQNFLLKAITPQKNTQLPPPLVVKFPMLIL